MLVKQNATINETPLNKKNTRGSWSITSSPFAAQTRNSIREVIENLQFEPNPDKEFIALSIGDPTLFGNLRPSPESIAAVQNVIVDYQHNGYAPSTGYVESKKAVAEYTNKLNGVNVTYNDVILCSGCSGSLELALTVLAQEGKNILVPRPGFSIYSTLVGGHNIETRFYNLNPNKNWEIDLDDLESKIDNNTAGIVVINPSNPCGSNYSKEHLLDILDVAERNYVPIIADEIYEHIVFPGNEFVSFAKLSVNVPILVCGGISKRFLVPGWRLGWIIIHDRKDIFGKDIRHGLQCLSQRLNGSNSLIQGALKDILLKTPQSFYDDLVNTLHKNAVLAYKMLRDVPGLNPLMPQGAMYFMLGVDMRQFPDFTTELDFVTQLVNEESVFCLPGSCFNFPGYLRLVITVPDHILQEACGRIIEFCKKYNKNNYIK